jgi:hypothetical protein
MESSHPSVGEMSVRVSARLRPGAPAELLTAGRACAIMRR